MNEEKQALRSVFPFTESASEVLQTHNRADWAVSMQKHRNGFVTVSHDWQYMYNHYKWIAFAIWSTCANARARAICAHVCVHIVILQLQVPFQFSLCSSNNKKTVRKMKLQQKQECLGIQKQQILSAHTAAPAERQTHSAQWQRLKRMAHRCKQVCKLVCREYRQIYFYK